MEARDMAKALKKIKKVSSPGKAGIPILHRVPTSSGSRLSVGKKVESLSSKVRKVLSKAVFKKKPAVKAKTTRLAAVRKALTAQEAKYFTHPENRIAKTVQAVEPARADFEKKELPQGYDKDLIVLQVRDPWWLHTYWEVREGTWGKLKNELAKLFATAKKVLRVYDVSCINFNGSNAHRSFDIEIHQNAKSWYIDTAGPGRSWCVDVGLKLSDGRFITIARSNIVTTPLDAPSWVTDEEWMVPDELFSRLYASSVGLGGSPVKLKAPWLELQKRAQGSGGVSSGFFSPVKKEEYKREFWLVVNTELIVYGATEPDAKVTVSGKEIALRPDGTFSLRFSLPDGKQIIPVKAVSADSLDERVITPVVTKETR
ncbi:MAG TPA: hypothetical protein DEA99_05645 [Candidatus Omnitrophica bacterium]|nr:hypothetical protein [Candidatus Omnitrophota bacterium]